MVGRKGLEPFWGHQGKGGKVNEDRPKLVAHLVQHFLEDQSRGKRRIEGLKSEHICSPLVSGGEEGKGNNAPDKNTNRGGRGRGRKPYGGLRKGSPGREAIRHVRLEAVQSGAVPKDVLAVRADMPAGAHVPGLVKARGSRNAVVDQGPVDVLDLVVQLERPEVAEEDLEESDVIWVGRTGEGEGEEGGPFGETDPVDKVVGVELEVSAEADGEVVEASGLVLVTKMERVDDARLRGVERARGGLLQKHGCFHGGARGVRPARRKGVPHATEVGPRDGEVVHLANGEGEVPEAVDHKPGGEDGGDEGVEREQRPERILAEDPCIKTEEGE
jgi:hypothetical protein